MTSSEQAIPASDRRVLHELIDGLSSSDAVAAHRFLSYLQVTPDPSGQPRYYGDPGQSVDVDAPYWDPVVILIGPCDGMGAIDDLIDAIDRAPFLSVSFRLFRDGIYRVDGRTTDRVRLGEWLAARKRVRSVVDDKAALHVRPLPLVP